MMELLFASLFGTETKDPEKMRENWIKGYMRAYEEARKVVPPEQRLEYSLEQGWEPLCKFLGSEVPEKPFPMKNTTTAFETGINKSFKSMWIRAVKMNAPYVVAALAVAYAWWWYR